MKTDRLHQLLNERPVLYGMLIRDPAMSDLELLARSGCHVIWIDMEHAPFNPWEVVQLCRTAVQLGMVPMVRIVELIRTHVQLLLDGGAQTLILPDVRNADQAAELARMSKFPPEGQRGVSSSAPVFDYNLGADVGTALQAANQATHLMVQIENDEGLENLESICAVAGVDLVTVGPADWAIGLGLFGSERDAIMSEKIDALLTGAAGAGKITAFALNDAKTAKHYVEIGVRILFVGIDVGLKRKAYADAIQRFEDVVG